MARYPAASWRRLPGDEPAITPRTVIFHTMVTTLPACDAYFRSGRSGGIESHFGVGGPWEGEQYDGVVWQWRDTEEQADANLKANAFAVSIETSDGGDPTRPWSPKQLDALVKLGNWLAGTHSIPRRICPAWDAGGFGYHVMFGAPGPWTPVAKTCPGPARIRQLREVVLPAIFAGGQLEEDDLTPEQAAQLDDVTASVNRIEAALFQGHAINPNHPIDNLFNAASKTHQALIVPGTTSAEQAFNMLFARVRNIETQVQTLVDALGDPVAEPPPAP